MSEFVLTSKVRNFCLNIMKITVTCLSWACTTDHGTAIPEFVVQRFNIWLHISPCS